VLVALRHAERTGEGQRIDLALYESVFRLLDELAPCFAATGYQREPMGAETPTIVPHNHYLTADDGWVAIACSTERMWQRLTKAMGREDLARDPRYATMGSRVERRAEVNQIVSNWTQSLPLIAVLEHCRREEVPCSKLLSIAEIFAHPQFAARENLKRIGDSRAGALTLPAPVPRMSRTPPKLTHAGPALGANNCEVFAEWLGLTDNDVAALRGRGVI
jgi:crotonobetainyl-CoA:carnitine CoA-transferase CaiB-like acyl-CoA transferase